MHIRNYSARHAINRILNTTESTLKAFVFNINDTPYARNLSISKDDTEHLLNGTYVANITFDNTDFEQIGAITLNDIKYTDYFETLHDKYLVVTIKLGVFLLKMKLVKPLI